MIVVLQCHCKAVELREKLMTETLQGCLVHVGVNMSMGIADENNRVPTEAWPGHNQSSASSQDFQPSVR